MCAPTPARKAPVILVLFTARIISVLLFDTLRKSRKWKEVDETAQTQLAGGVLWPASGCQQDVPLKLAILLISHYLVSARAAGLTFSHCEKHQTSVCALGGRTKSPEWDLQLWKVHLVPMSQTSRGWAPLSGDNTGQTRMLWQSWPGSCLSLVQLFAVQRHPGSIR